MGTSGFSWHDLAVILRQSPRESAKVRATDLEGHQWGLAEQLLAQVADMVTVANWQRGGGKKRDYPKQIPRPGVEPDETRYGKKPLPLDRMAEWLGWK